MDSRLRGNNAPRRLLSCSLVSSIRVPPLRPPLVGHHNVKDLSQHENSRCVDAQAANAVMIVRREIAKDTHDDTPVLELTSEERPERLHLAWTECGNISLKS